MKSENRAFKQLNIDIQNPRDVLIKPPILINNGLPNYETQ